MGEENNYSSRAPERKKKQIQDAALTVFIRKGYGEATVPDIAREAGVAVGTIYNYFESKRELLVSLMRERFFNASFEDLLNDAGQRDDISFIGDFFENRLRFGFENVDSFMFLLGEVHRDPVVRGQWVEQVLKPVITSLESFFVSQVSDGDNESAIRARAMAGMGIGFILLYSLEREKSPVHKSDPSVVARTLTTMIINGLKGGADESD